MKNIAIKVENVTKEYGWSQTSKIQVEALLLFSALDNVSFEIRKGEM
jgi:ABC-type oligopeptide transport system ATPase subunit